MHSLLPAFLDLVFAPRCLGCDGAAERAHANPLCALCRARLRPLPQPICVRCGAPRLDTGRADPQERCGECRSWPAHLRCARSAFMMHPPADRLVHQLKYHGWHMAARAMAEWMARVDLPADVREEQPLVVHVPTSEERRRTRGYDQAQLLAGHVAAALGMEVAGVLERVGPARTQTALQPAERGANVAGAFRVKRNAPSLQHRHVLLVDDVLTTGATVLECSTALAAAGARCVSVLTFTRAPGARRIETSTNGALNAHPRSHQRLRPNRT